MIRKIKTWWFNKQFDRYYNGLLLGELYNEKIKLLSDMTNNRELYLKRYLEKGVSLYRQIDEYLDAIIARCK